MNATSENKIILHIDDDEDDRQLVKESLCEREPGLRVYGVDNGRDALLFLQQAKKCGGLPGLIVMDLNMPVMNGREFLAKLKADPDLTAIRVVIFTTSSAPVDQALANQYGAEFITKPPSIHQLSQAIARLLYLFSIGYGLVGVNTIFHMVRR